MAYAMLTKHSAWDGVVAPTLGGVLRHGVEIPRSATLEYKSWETLSRESLEWEGLIQLGAIFGSGRLIEVLEYMISLLIPVHYP